MDLSKGESFFNGELLRVASMIELDESDFSGTPDDLLSRRGKDGMTLLMFAVGNKKFQSIRGLVAAGAEVSLEIPKLGSPIRLAALSDEPRISRAMFEGGATPNERLRGGTPILFSAVCEGHDEVINEFLKAGVDVDATSIVGNTVVHEALFCQRFDRAFKMVALLKNVDVVNGQGLSIEDLALRFQSRATPGSEQNTLLNDILREIRSRKKLMTR